MKSDVSLHLITFDREWFFLLESDKITKTTNFDLNYKNCYISLTVTVKVGPFLMHVHI